MAYLRFQNNDSLNAGGGASFHVHGVNMRGRCSEEGTGKGQEQSDQEQRERKEGKRVDKQAADREI